MIKGIKGPRRKRISWVRKEEGGVKRRDFEEGCQLIAQEGDRIRMTIGLGSDLDLDLGLGIVQSCPRAGVGDSVMVVYELKMTLER